MPKITSSRGSMGPLPAGVSTWHTAGIHRTTGTGCALSWEFGENGLLCGNTSWKEIPQACYADQLLLLANSVVSKSGTELTTSNQGAIPSRRCRPTPTFFNFCLPLPVAMRLSRLGGPVDSIGSLICPGRGRGRGLFP